MWWKGTLPSRSIVLYDHLMMFWAAQKATLYPHKSVIDEDFELKHVLGV